MALPTGAMQLAGFLMAHALWTTAELPAEGVYVPQALCQTAGGDRQLVSFDAPDHKQSMEQARAFLESTAPGYADCALAHEALIDTGVDTGHGAVNALVIDLFEGGNPLVTVVQPFRPAAEAGGFRLLGNEVLIDTRGPVPPLQADAAIGPLHEGASDHPGLGEQWAKWNSTRDPHSPFAP
jgi:hypothetical protein